MHQTSRVFPKTNKTLWCEQVPVVGFNSGRYNLHLIRKYFVTHLGQEKRSLCRWETGTNYVHKHTPFQVFGHHKLFVTRHQLWQMGQDLWPQSDQVLASIRMFDSAHKLDYKGLPPYWCWYSQLRNSFVLTPAEYEECKRVFQERGMKTLRDWLEYYNNLDVTPFLETLEKIKAFYTKLGIDIFKDAVSLPGVSMQCILRGTLRGRDPPPTVRPKWRSIWNAERGCGRWS